MKAFFYTLYIYSLTIYRYFYLFRKQSRGLIKETGILIEGKEYPLDRPVIKRMRLYYLMSKLTLSWLCALRGYKANRKENLCMFYYGAITPLIDDLNDSLKLRSVDIKRFLKDGSENPHETVPLIRKLYVELEKNCSSKFLEVFDEALVKQDESIKQIEEERLSNEKLKEISYGKGGIFVFLYRLVLEQPLKKGEEEAIYQLGYVIQLLNDMFDTYKDHSNKQQTLFTNAIHMEKCKEEYEGSLQKMKELFLELDYKKTNIKRSLNEISSFTSMGKVCMEQLMQCQEQTNQQFKIAQYSRKQLICDMGKWANKIMSFKFSIQDYKNILKQLKIKGVKQ